MRRATTLERLLGRAVRVLLGGAVAALLLIGGTAREDRATGARAIAGTEWVELARATFKDVPDGAGDSKSFPAEIGKLTTVAPAGKSFKDVAGSSGVSGGMLVLSDAGTSASSSFGVRLTPTADAASAALLSFTLVQRSDAGALGADVSDGATSEMCSSGDVSDGATSEFISVQVVGGTVTVNGHALDLRVTKGAVYRVDIGAFDVVDDADFFEVRLTNVDTAESETFRGELAGGFRPVRGLTVRKLAGEAGEFALDNLSIVAPAK